MRISDWSSDVCSSDLRVLDFRQLHPALDAPLHDHKREKAHGRSRRHHQRKRGTVDDRFVWRAWRMQQLVALAAAEAKHHVLGAVGDKIADRKSTRLNSSH